MAETGAFEPLSSILSCTAKAVTGSASGADVWLLSEAMAQLGGMHLRWRTNFDLHVFLVGVEELVLPAPPLQGMVDLNGEVIRWWPHRNCYSYRVYSSVHEDRVHALFHYGTAPFKRTFITSPKELYEERFRWLNSSKIC